MAGLKDNVAISCMFFAGLILLIPHRIGMSRVNYVIKRYNLPISRAGLLLYKYHNNIELSLLCGTLPMIVIIWYGGGFFGLNPNKWNMSTISICMIAFLILMLLSSIIMFIIYILGGDFGHLNAFYFSLIFLTLFDGFANAFAFAINAKYSSLLSAGIPLSGLLVTLLHYIYKFFSDLFHWDDFDYYVLRLQLIFNIIFIFIALCLWIWDYKFKSGEVKPVAQFTRLFSTDSGNNHFGDWSPILMLAISLGTVYAFYPSIAPYSIIDFQYASIVELWILIISALLPLLSAILDYPDFGYGPSGKKSAEQEITLTGNNKEVETGQDKVDFSDEKLRKITLSNIEVTHTETTPGSSNITHGGKACGDTTSGNNTYHAYRDGDTSHKISYTLNKINDKVQDNSGQEVAISTYTTSGITLDATPTKIKYKVYYNWFYKPSKYISGIAANDTSNKVKFTAGDTTGVPPNKIKLTLPKHETGAGKVNWTEDGNPPDEYNRIYWNCIWLCAIFYILCIQIFMSLLHYPHCLLSCFFNNPGRIQFISILFNTVRELMQACGFAGAGKQCNNLDKDIGYVGTIFNLTYTATGKKVYWKDSSTLNEGDIKLANANKPPNLTGTYTNSGSTQPLDFTKMKADISSVKLPLPGWTPDSVTLKIGGNNFNSTIAATNKLITLFVMMFCVFTGDGYLQHYRRCCRDNWPTTGYNKYQSFFYWLHFGFKGGIKSFITSSFTDLYYHNK